MDKGAKLMNDLQDNWRSYEYAKHRYLDALANIFSMQEPCTAISLFADKHFSLSYNSTATAITMRKVGELKTYINNKDKESLLGFYLYYNIDFRLSLEMFCNKNAVDENLKKEVKALCAKLKDPGIKSQYNNNNKNQLFPSKNLKEVSEDYMKILKNSEIKKIPQEIILRPFQDVSKILDLNVKIDVISFLHNKDEVHAELNVSYNTKKGDYIGVSKLSCYDCDSKLTNEGYPHRGTYNIWFSDGSEAFNIDQKKLIDNNDLVLHKYY